MNRVVSIIVFLTLFGVVPVGIAVETVASGTGAEMAALLESGSARFPGSPANLFLVQRVAERFAASGMEHGEMVFEAPVFRPGKTTLRLPGTGPVRLLPLHPTIGRPGNFTEQSFSAVCVYAGRCSIADLAQLEGVELRDRIVLLEFDCGDDWQELLRFGVRGFVFLAADRYYRVDSLGKLYATEVRVPRFFADRDSSAALRAAATAEPGGVTAQIEATPSRWEAATLSNQWVLIPGADRELRNDVVVVTAPLDSDCIVPELAFGGQNGANAYLLLKLFEEFLVSPPARSVLFAAVNAHTQRFRGERMLAWHLLAPRSAWEKAQDTLAEDLREQMMFLDQYGKLSFEPDSRQADEDYLVRMRTLVDNSTGKHRTIKEPLVDLIRREVNLLKSEQLALVRRGGADRDVSVELEALRARRETYVRVLTLFNKIGIQTTLSDLSVEEVAILRAFVATIRRRNGRWAELNRRELQLNASSSRIREALAGRRVFFVISLDLSWQSDRIGFCSNNRWGVERWPHRWGANVARVAAQLRDASPAAPGAVFVDAMTKRGGLPEEHFFPYGSLSLAVFQGADRTPAFSLMNVHSDWGRAFTPADTVEALDPVVVQGVIDYVPRLFRAVLADPKLTVPSELGRPTVRAIWSTQVKTFKFDDFSASVLPQLPVPGTAVTLMSWSASGAPPVVSGDVTRARFVVTDDRASRMVYGVTEPILLTSAFHPDADWVGLDHVIDAGDIEAKMSSNIYPGTQSKLLPLFQCVEFPVYTRHNTAAIAVSPILSTTYIVLSGRLNSAPKKYGIMGASSKFSKKGVPRLAGPAAFYLQPGEQLKLLTESKALALNAGEDAPEGRGFGDPEAFGSDFFATASQDMATLNRHRLERLSGIADDLSQDFQRRGEEALTAMASAREERRHLGFLRALYAVQGAYNKAYQRAAAVTNDMLKAVVFYLALLLPFCFFMEKLLFKFKRIESEMTAFGLLFVLTFLVFREIHPAFRVAQAPEAIFVAFVMLGLGLFVIKILHGRFEGEMQLLFRTYPGMEAGTAGYSIVGQEAMLIGVNNMKRRRLRTGLTTATVVLVTFTMLAFTSISRKMSPTVVSRSNNPPYTGIMYHWPGNSRMDEATLRTLREVFFGRATCVVRRWLLPQSYRGETIPLRVSTSNATEGQLDGVLGLSLAENGFLGEIPLAVGRYFSADGADEVILPTSMARALGVSDADCGRTTLRFRDRELTIVGLLVDKSFRMMRDLNQRPLLPIKSMVKQEQGEGDIEAMVMGEDAEEAEEGVFYVDMSSLILVPITTARQLGAQPYSLSIRFGDSEPIWDPVDELLTLTNASKFHISSEVPFSVGFGGKKSSNAGVYYIGEGYRTSIGGLSSLIIPLLISATIILNTMLGSVFERKREIMIYNAVGLNPTHIGMFFLAESFVYSVVGSVGGYLIGQVTAIVLTRSGLITDINLNFSSLSVVYVIAFTIAVVLLSTLYPSMVATKAAVPSGKRKWSLPSAQGNAMEVVFPFIYQVELIRGVLAYLEEYFGRFTEASFGDLIAVSESRDRDNDEEGRERFALHYHVALAPFDLGVTQRVIFRAAFDDRVQAYQLTMDVLRLSGQDTNWMTTNKPFLERLRTYLLHWRNLSAGEHGEYTIKGEAIFPSVTVHGRGTTDEH